MQEVDHLFSKRHWDRHFDSRKVVKAAVNNILLKIKKKPPSQTDLVRVMQWVNYAPHSNVQLSRQVAGNVLELFHYNGYTHAALRWMSLIIEKRRSLHYQVYVNLSSSFDRYVLEPSKRSPFGTQIATHYVRLLFECYATQPNSGAHGNVATHNFLKAFASCQDYYGLLQVYQHSNLPTLPSTLWTHNSLSGKSNSPKLNLRPTAFMQSLGLSGAEPSVAVNIFSHFLLNNVALQFTTESFQDTLRVLKCKKDLTTHLPKLLSLLLQCPEALQDVDVELAFKELFLRLNPGATERGEFRDLVDTVEALIHLKST
jgi:hypothetical protein